jgi:5-methylcytosine-specific restriction endonuclease McrA
MKTNRKKLVEKLDKICSLLTKEGAHGLCEICGGAGSQTHHYFSKKVHGAVRWDLDNLLWLCFSCHIRKVHQQADSEDAREAIINRIGLDLFLSLKERAHEIRKFKEKDLEELIEALK